MANSRSPYHFGRDPFQPQPLTPGPLGHNDAASPTLNALVGDTPGPLGVRDHAVPFQGSVIAEALTSNRVAARLPFQMRISEEGVKFIWSEEFVPNISLKLHWPKGASGVTLGAGYDMKCRTRNEVRRDMHGIGLSDEIAERAAEGAGLSGPNAYAFVRDHAREFAITEAQAIMLLKIILPSYESVVRRLVKVCLVQHEFDALVSFAYNPGGRFRRVADLLNTKDTAGAMRTISSANTSGGKVLRGLVARRKREVDLFVKGAYT